MESSLSEPHNTEHWFLLRYKVNTWKKTRNNLEGMGIEVCMPLQLDVRQRADRKNSLRIVKSPLFPGYLFIKINPSVFHPSYIKRQPGIIEFVKFGDEMATIDHREIEFIRDYLTIGNTKVSLSCPSFDIHYQQYSALEKILDSEISTERIIMLLSHLKKNKYGRKIITNEENTVKGHFLR